MMKKKLKYLLILPPLLLSCLESPDMADGIVNAKRAPTVETSMDFEIPLDGNILMKGNINSLGIDNRQVTGKGFLWGNSAENLNNVLYSNDASNSFSAVLNNVAGNKTYYWKAFAKNGFGSDTGLVVRFSSPEIWESKKYFNAHPRSKGASFVLGSRIFTTCGERAESAGLLLNDAWEYTISDNEWPQIDDFPGMKRRYPVGFAIGNYAFVGTGQGFDQNIFIFNDFYRYDDNTKQWEDVPTETNMDERYNAVAFDLNGKGYLVGGLHAPGQLLSDVWQFTLTTEGNGYWQKMNNFPFPFYGGISISDHTSAFIGFGDNSETHRSLWKYREEDDEWLKFADLPEEITKKIYSGVIVKDNIYIVDGDNVLWTLSLTDKSWQKKTLLPDVFLNKENEGGFQNLFTTQGSNSIYIGIGFTGLFYEYRPLWDN